MCQPKKKRMISLGFDEGRFEEGQHICYLFADDRERLGVLARYLESGRREGEKLLYLADTLSPSEMLAELERLGLEVGESPGTITVAEARESYCPSGAFDPDEMLSIVRDFYIQAVEKEGHPGARGTGEMSWCLDNGADCIKLMEYEARLNQLLVEYPYTACCQYDTRRFPGDVILDVLQVHPLTIVNGQLVRNPFFVKPEVFLARLLSKNGEGPA